MTTTGTVAFTLEIADVVEEAAMRAGGVPLAGNETLGAMRLLDLMLADWQNRGIMLWTLTNDTIPLVQGTQTYTLPADTIDIYAAALHRGAFDFLMPRLTYEKWLGIPNKTTQGRPTQYFIERLRDAPVMHLWLVPENSTDSINYWRIKFIQDSNLLARNPDMPRRYLPALVSGLAWYLSLRRQKVGYDLQGMLKQNYEDELQRAMEEDRERATFEAKPRLRV